MSKQNILYNDQFIKQFSQAVYQFFSQILFKQKINENTIKNFQQALKDLFESDYENKFINYLGKQPFNYQASYYSYCDIDSWETKKEQSIKLLDYNSLVTNICRLVGRYVWSKEIVLKMLKQEQQVQNKICQLVQDKCIENFRYAKSSTEVLSHHELEKQIQQKGGGIDRYEIKKQLKSKYNTTFATPSIDSEQEEFQQNLSDSEQEEFQQKKSDQEIEFQQKESEQEESEQEESDQEESDQEESEQEEFDQEESKQEESEQEQSEQEELDQEESEQKKSQKTKDHFLGTMTDNEQTFPDQQQQNIKEFDVNQQIVNNSQKKDNNNIDNEQQNNPEEEMVPGKKSVKNEMQSNTTPLERRQNINERKTQIENENNSYSSDEQQDEKSNLNQKNGNLGDSRLTGHQKENNKKDNLKSQILPTGSEKPKIEDYSSDDESVNLPKDKNNKQINTFWD